ncbi:bifunctional [glutamate--ammonia ligase]-adenylyl-L-tyrosine phosphorylase/[glutamate--ammonia-ligase] adenylyltransferase [Geoalkalibacter halelectricus]|uniref:Bifunctional [glutamate--ammonia ligase]-adenylyl-L-tyrosine phosphorylase/[glutamate--ammonia-ligase] adenylyltransferase n=1 Tax=Geoalkalibacter halelectricus TaxID=2847045 RepID=A0ABY5ZLT0_9BACT|nr:bifunctional [glutamate--ammonia ligase]-adenylyl-L-tyrosine phosphorylase/[glutamate--ammonia-ligase] adenylyltransferase [Geoalkalibacter halelectricus]MDO3378620.1 bifunctional [glutamate--ammonia ligase]-adenylyl-L-tyrosine phosphorylase/[glutamate--ammonia-ligase] adenylyltransferase [Geoalkalibacter halelectricus]UWZ80068.1 bifunctional [glutamate--ammonia ligase]-adenylyl-L-tyrosine phosphorylase/[glutamate--ammonia-ligase] adenylyltransferase [Geoalkalibacter halelectricus]
MSGASFSTAVQACVAGDEARLAALLADLGYVDGKRSAVNLVLLHQALGEETLLEPLLRDALEAAGADDALNHLERLAAGLPAADLAAVLGSEVGRRHLLKILGASSFLAGILCRDRHYFQRLLPEGDLLRQKSRAEMAAELRDAIADEADFETLQAGLRRYKRREILRIGGRDLCGLADLVETTADLADLAGASLHRAYQICDRLLRAEYGAPLLEEGGGEPEFSVLGMGKLGGRELNFSSDIDLIYLYSSERGETAGIPDGRGATRNRIGLHQYFVKLAEMLTRAIAQVTADGFVFRVDLNLRPEGSRGEMAISQRGAEVYYESWGQSWERAALLKARPVAGSLALGERTLKSLEPFIYRRYLDYGMVEDIKTMKLKVDRNLARQREGELNLKLGRGGIREIEFFIQALQLIYAGKNPHLRERNSLRALELLRREGLIKDEDQRQLHAAYVFLRTVEHRIQVVQERQTHNLPKKDAELRLLARRSGYQDAAAFAADLERHRQGVHAIYRDLFFTSEEKIREDVRPEIQFLFDSAAESDLVKDLLEEKGFRNVEGAYENLLLLRDGGPYTHLTERGRRILDRIAPLLLQEVVDSPEPEMALNNLVRFFAALRARSTFYALLAENRQIVRMLVNLFGTSQFLSRIFIQHPEILDALVARQAAMIRKSKERLRGDLAEHLARAEDYEGKLDALRRFRSEEFLRIALHDLSGKLSLAEGTEQLSLLADVCLEQAVDIARAELLPRFGIPLARLENEEPREAAFAIVGLGKLGGHELTYHSDLDIIFIYEADGGNAPAPETDPERFRELTNQDYFSRLAQRVISVLTLQTREGYVYKIDTRLRPSGNQGPLVTSLPAFERYHEANAALWERQALTKARVITGPRDFARRLEDICLRQVYERPVPPQLKTEIYRLRSRMETEIARERADHFNIKTGRGGMVDVEFLAQYLQLLHGGAHHELRIANTTHLLGALHRLKFLDSADFQALGSGYVFLRRLENKLRLVHDQSINDLSGERAYLVKLARRLGYPERPLRADQAFLADYRRVTEDIRGVFQRFLGPEVGEADT